MMALTHLSISFILCVQNKICIAFSFQCLRDVEFENISKAEDKDPLGSFFHFKMKHPERQFYYFDPVWIWQLGDFLQKLTTVHLRTLVPSSGFIGKSTESAYEYLTLDIIVTVSLSNFDRWDSNMGVFLQSTEAMPRGNLLTWKLTPTSPPADTMFMAAMAMVLPWKIIENFQSFIRNTKL